MRRKGKYIIRKAIWLLFIVREQVFKVSKGSGRECQSSYFSFFFNGELELGKAQVLKCVRFRVTGTVTIQIQAREGC